MAHTAVLSFIDGCCCKTDLFLKILYFISAPLPPTNFSISKDKRHPVLNLTWALSDKSWQDQLNIKIGTQHHTLNPHIILRNVTRFSPTEYALSTLTLPKAVDLTIKMSASSFGVEGPDSISVIIKLSEL